MITSPEQKAGLPSVRQISELTEREIIDQLNVFKRSIDNTEEDSSFRTALLYELWGELCNDYYAAYGGTI